MMNWEADIEKALAILESGGIMLYPTDTIWGLGCDATNPEAVSKIFHLKEREESKSMVILLAEERDVMQYVTQLDPEVFVFLESVTKPTTVVYDGAIGLAENLVNDDGSIAIRITADPFCRHLLKRFRKPIVSTSANRSGDPSPAHFGEVNPAIIQGVDYVVQFRQEERTAAAPSAIIRWSNSGSPVFIRESI